MIENRIAESAGRVAVVAVIATADMILVLALCRATVMTARAGADDREMIDLQCRPPGARRMTVLAEIRRVDMCDRFFRGGRGTGGGVAGCALTRRSLEDAAQMAVRTGGVAMAAGQWESGREMVEFFIRNSGGVSENDPGREEQD